ncbi:MAG: hypothetical protein ACRBK7_03375 [Acidimicrobiales bacterium]
MTSEDAGLDVDLASTVESADEARAAEDSSGIPHGGLLMEFAEAVVRRSDQVDSLRSALVELLGPEATAHAAATITAFSGLVRVADGAGIPIDDGLASASVDTRQALGLHSFGGANNSVVDDIAAAEFTSIDALFDNSATSS